MIWRFDFKIKTLFVFDPVQPFLQFWRNTSIQKRIPPQLHYLLKWHGRVDNTSGWSLKKICVFKNLFLHMYFPVTPDLLTKVNRNEQWNDSVEFFRGHFWFQIDWVMWRVLLWQSLWVICMKLIQAITCQSQNRKSKGTWDKFITVP